MTNRKLQKHIKTKDVTLHTQTYKKERDICCHRVSICLSVCLSVCHKSEFYLNG